jgi:hypothetical protein
MQQTLHPLRYRETMSAALVRIERIAASGASEDRLTSEFADMNPTELSERREHLNHVETLIAKWASDGCRVYDTSPILDDLVHSESAPFVVARSLGETVIYVHLGAVSSLTMDIGNTFWIEGFYLRKSHADNGDVLELTFVCNGNEWKDLELRSFGSAIRCASRVAVCELPVGSLISDALKSSYCHGEDELLVDDGFERARHLASAVISILTTETYAATAFAVRHPDELR